MSRRLKFRGESLNKVDGKGRVSIPASFRRVLEAGDPDWQEGQQPNLVIVYGNTSANYLECYTISEMEEIEDRISRMKRGPRRRLLERIYSSGSNTMSVDETGRIVLSAKLREKAGIDGEAQFASTINSFQIWNPATYEAEALGGLEEMLEEQDDDFHPLDYLDADEDEEMA